MSKDLQICCETNSSRHIIFRICKENNEEKKEKKYNVWNTPITAVVVHTYIQFKKWTGMLDGYPAIKQINMYVQSIFNSIIPLLVHVE